MKTYSGAAAVEYQSFSISFDDGDFTAAATTQTFNLCKPSASSNFTRGWVLLAAHVTTDESFTFSDDADVMSLQIGTDGSTASIIANAAVTASGTELTTSLSDGGGPAKTIQALFTASKDGGGGSPTIAECTAGKVTIHLVWASEPTTIVPNIAQ
tara:strand:- start:1832 stop:2296 length:465 start_codon:yes stop_codon:yes gene_type:complete